MIVFTSERTTGKAASKTEASEKLAVHAQHGNVGHKFGEGQRDLYPTDAGANKPMTARGVSIPEGYEVRARDAMRQVLNGELALVEFVKAFPEVMADLPTTESGREFLFKLAQPASKL